MIVLTLLLVLASLGLLTAGLVANQLALVVASIVASLLGGLTLFLGVRQRRGEPLPPVDGVDGAAAGWQAGTVRPAAGDEHPADHGTADDFAEEPYPPLDEPPEEAVSDSAALQVARLTHDVLVIDGRPRYHLASCPHLLGRRSQPLPVSEARDLGFTPCALCGPDTTLLSGRTAGANGS